MSSRLPPHPRLDWGDDGVPRATDMDDVYFSVADGLAETEVVFLKGCGLPDAWKGRKAFNVGELGFGSGLNILALWELWRRKRPGPTARLNVMSFEGRPLSREDASRALSAWPRLAGLADHLLRQWPIRARGVQRIHLGDGVHLTLHIDDIQKALPQAEGLMDAWFLDGFSPAKNPDMWSEDTLRHVGRLTAPGGRVGSYTVAGAVRRGLETAGFNVAKRPGFGRKRERLEAVKRQDAEGAARPSLLSRPPSTPPSTPPNTVLVVGAGVAGAACAAAFAARGCEVSVIDAARPASGASGNARALVMPRLDASDTPAARMLISAYVAARQAYSAMPTEIAAIVDARHLARTPMDRGRFEKLFADPPLDEDLFAPLDPNKRGAGAIHGGAIILTPRALIAHWLDQLNLITGMEAVRLESGDRPRLHLSGGAALDADLIILANGMDAAQLLGTHTPPLEARLGQIETAPMQPDATFATASGDYAIQSGDTLVFGATFEPHGGGPARISDEARAQNLSALQVLDAETARSVDASELTSRAGLRATTPDRLPLVGAVPDVDRFRDLYGEALAKGRPLRTALDRPPPFLPGVRIASGYGSRGFTWAPWAAELLASEAFGEPLPIETSVRDAAAPGRFLVRDLKRRTQS
ncbi:MAG: FAD-dependent 5-carboxymethylaminomethyl-2-thiouridine(34) oxidoreductase MnmC [Pseudomonadota bacterium]